MPFRETNNCRQGLELGSSRRAIDERLGRPATLVLYAIPRLVPIVNGNSVAKVIAPARACRDWSWRRRSSEKRGSRHRNPCAGDLAGIVNAMRVVTAQDADAVGVECGGRASLSCGDRHYEDQDN